MTKKLSVTVLCGGESTEHEISIQSALNVIKALNSEKYDVSMIYITHMGAWYYTRDIAKCLQNGLAAMMQAEELTPVSVQFGAKTATFISARDQTKTFETDCVFPMLHGTHGEDGCIQGLLQLLGAVCVGDDVLSSAVCMDKDITKQLLRANGIATAPWVSISADDVSESLYDHIANTRGKDLFVKPNSLGSSVGIARVTTADEFFKAVEAAFRYDSRLIIEPSIKGREIECAVLGNEEPMASLPAEIVSHHDFYSYDAKYLDAKGASTIVPANLAQAVVNNIRQMSVDAFKVLRCSGMLRVDFFLVDDKTLMINEVNTIPGFTNISMYPQMWQASNIDFAELLDQLINLALSRHQRLNRLERVYSDPESVEEIKQLNEDRLL